MWAKIRNKAKIFLSILAVYISATGLVTFSLFIIEESIQTSMFGTWQAISANDWNAAMLGYDCIKSANGLLKTVNNSLGWIQPLSFLAYRSYGNATDAYIQGLEARIFANAPELFDGREVSFTFIPETVRSDTEGYAHINRKITVISSISHPIGSKRRITGKVAAEENRVVVREIDFPHTMATNPVGIAPAAKTQ